MNDLPESIVIDSTKKPADSMLIKVVANTYGVDLKTAARWLKEIDWSKFEHSQD